MFARGECSQFHIFVVKMFVLILVQQKRRQTIKPPAGGNVEGERGSCEVSGGDGRSLVSAPTALQVLRTNLAEATGTPVSPVAPTKEVRRGEQWGALGSILMYLRLKKSWH